MTFPSEREVLLDIARRCAWLIDYYERTGITPKSVEAFRALLTKTLSDLAEVECQPYPQISQVL